MRTATNLSLQAPASPRDRVTAAPPHRRWRLARRLCFCVALVGISARLPAQGVRDSLIVAGQQAKQDFEFERAVDLLRAGLNPALGAPDSLWGVGVQLLANVLLEQYQRDSVATTWLKWALRQVPDLALEPSTQFVIGPAYQIAKDFVQQTSIDESLAETRVRWSAGGERDSTGDLQIGAGSLSADYLVVGIGGVARGQLLSALPPGSYTIQASVGDASAPITTEVLPGATTVLLVHQLPVAVAAVPDSVIPPDVLEFGRTQLVRLGVRPFGVPERCATGFFVGGADGLVMTTYAAIRGAGVLTASVAGGPIEENRVSVAAYDVATNVAVLKLPSSWPDSLRLSDGTSDLVHGWRLQHASCDGPEVSRRSIARRRADALEFGDSIRGTPGGPLIDNTGAVLAVDDGGPSAGAVARARRILEAARRNVAAGALRTPLDVARRENHRYGAVALSSAVRNAVASISPLESWHWEELATRRRLPFTFAAPTGRYRLQIESRARDTTFLVPAGARASLVFPEPVRPVAPAAPPPEPAKPPVVVRRRGRFPWPLALLGLAVGGGAVAYLASGSGDGGGGGTGGPPDSGGITIRVPKNP